MPRSARLLTPVLAFFCIAGHALLAQSSSCVNDKKNPCNGISVGKPKVFDNRTLTLMIENLSQTLQNMQTGFINQQSVAAALGNIQGFQTHEVTSSLQVNPVPIPGLTQAVTNSTGNVDTSGNILPNNGQSNTTQTQTTTSSNAFTPTAPALDAAPTFSGFNPTYGENAADLLTDQVNLSYQIFNLRMILDRALSDRLLHDAKPGENSTRLQAVLGFNVSIDPPRTANDAVAVVEISLCNKPESEAKAFQTKTFQEKRKDENNGGVCGAEAQEEDRGTGFSLVALMPQEKTYNAASLSSKSNAFGGTAVVKTIQVGYSQRRSGQTFYLYRDNDTISYERMDPDRPNELIFGWTFRPVLGRRSVSPGMRQLFAVASLPVKDCTDEDQARKPGAPTPVCLADLAAHVRTYWKKYDAGTLTSFLPHDENRATRLKYAATFQLTRPEIFENRYLNFADYYNIRVESSSTYQNELGPVVTKVSWTPIGSKMVLVSAIGNNFFTGTQVAIGDKTYSGAGDGLVLKSNQAFDLLTTADALAAGPGAIIGRYGTSVPLYQANTGQQQGIQITEAKTGPALSGTRSLNIYLGSHNGGPLSVQDLPLGPDRRTTTPLIYVGGSTLPLPYNIVQVSERRPGQTDIPRVLLQTAISDSQATAANGTIRVTWPFLSEIWTSTYHVTNPADAYQAARVGEKGLLLFSKNEAGFVRDPHDPITALSATSCWQILAADQPIKLRTSTCTGGDNSSQGLGPNTVFVTLKAAAPDNVVLLDPYGAAFTLTVPKATSSDADKTKVVMLKQYDSTWTEIAVDDGSAVGSVEANQTHPAFVVVPGKNGEKSKSIKVEITRDLTSKPGNLDLTVLDKNGKSITAVKLQVVCTDCKNSDGGK